MSATRHVEHDALTALRAELVGAAERRISRRRGRRRTAVIVAIVVLLVAATAATAALMESSTGVPAVDRLLDVDVPDSRHPAGPGSASDSLRVPEGDHMTNVVAYRARDGSICIASADFKRGGSARGSYGGCPPLADVNRRVRRRGGIWFGAALGTDQRTSKLLVAGDVRSMQPLDKGDWSVLMTAPWTPPGRGGRPLRLVVLVDEADIAEEELTRARLGPDVELSYADGHTRVLRGP
jgi:hypothetical protein